MAVSCSWLALPKKKNKEVEAFLLYKASSWFSFVKVQNVALVVFGRCVINAWVDRMKEQQQHAINEKATSRAILKEVLLRMGIGILILLVLAIVAIGYLVVPRSVES
mmetsp:Transcript_19552/g.53843  ORF Transcript_19552/g.53843 Transcript_19552/m.53843 type:complete len:107 (+) Transcript_19552:1680-2000(+)